MIYYTNKKCLICSLLVIRTRPKRDVAAKKELIHTVVGKTKNRTKQKQYIKKNDVAAAYETTHELLVCCFCFSFSFIILSSSAAFASPKILSRS